MNARTLWSSILAAITWWRKIEPCVECGRPASTRHHIVPKALGGRRAVYLCAICHSRAHHQMGVISRMSRRARGEEAKADRVMTLLKSGLPVRQVSEETGVPIRTIYGIRQRFTLIQQDPAAAI